MKKPGRNDLCPCGSGKKFKKCCESKMLGGRFQVTKVEPAPKAGGLTALFHSSTVHMQTKPNPPKEEAPKEEKPPEESTSEDPQP